MTYIDGFVLVVPKKNYNKYKKMASDAGKIWKKFGALEYIESVGDDLHPDMGGMKAQNFQKMTKLKKNENVWFSYIVYKNKKHRDSVNKKVTEYFNKKYPNNKHQEMPFDMTKMAYGGFKTIVRK
jgi:uncharacterized protein YbaA (DUF1428 family)